MKAVVEAVVGHLNISPIDPENGVLGPSKPRVNLPNLYHKDLKGMFSILSLISNS